MLFRAVPETDSLRRSTAPSTGGSHSPISGHYGLAANNIPGLEEITPAENIVTLNQCFSTDLFSRSEG